jgi:phospholipid/cholesterol/gamma-HCH transport system substrate-binding protein
VKRGVRKQLGAALWLLALAAVGLVVGGYLVGHQRLTVPSWVPFAGQSRFVLNARLSSAAGVLPGQGQAVTVSGVKVGEIASVGLKDGAAVLKLNIEPRFAHIHRDGTVLLRPKTGLKDMIAELDPGKTGPELRSGATLGTDATNPDVNLDEILASLDAETRDSLVLLIGGAGEALGKGNGSALANTLRRFGPLSRDTAKATSLVAARRAKLKRLMHNLSALAGELGKRDQQLGTFVNASAAVFRRFSNQNLHLAKTLKLLPGTLDTTSSALAKLDTLGSTLTSGLRDLGPSAKALGPTLHATQPFLKTTTPVLKDELRPFAREAQPTAKKLVPAARDLAKATPDLTTLTDALNAIVNELAYKPPGNGASNQSYLFYVPWASHDTNSVLSSQDAIGATRRGLVLVSCGTLEFLESQATPKRNPTLSTLIQLLNAPNYRELIAKGSCKYTQPPKDRATATATTASVPLLTRRPPK